MPFQPISREQFSVTPFYTYKSYNLTQASSGVSVMGAYSGAPGYTGAIYGAIKNMYGTGADTIFGQKNLTCPEYIQIIGISKEIYGDEIAIGTFSIYDYYYSPSVVHLFDDGRGNLYDYDFRYVPKDSRYEFRGSGSIQFITGSCGYCTTSVEDFMLEFYFKMHYNFTESAIFSRRASATGVELYLLGITNNLTFYLGDDAGNSVSNANTSLSIANGAVNHVVAVFDRSGDATFYLNGSSGTVTGIPIAAVSSTIYDSTAPLALGIRYNGILSSSFSGGLITFRYYNFGSGGLPYSISEYVKFNYNSSSIHNHLVKSLIEEWDWKSGSHSLTGSISGQLLTAFGNPHYRSNQVVGNIFYSKGFAVITETSNIGPYKFIGSGSGGTGMNVYLKSVVKRDEMKIECFSPAGAQNATQNRTSIWGTSSYLYGKNVTGSGTSSYEYRNNPTIPYVTTIGAYSENGELLLIGKLAKPIPKKDDLDITFVLSLDL